MKRGQFELGTAQVKTVDWVYLQVEHIAEPVDSRVLGCTHSDFELVSLDVGNQSFPTIASFMTL